jgi:hypothetical protein
MVMVGLCCRHILRCINKICVVGELQEEKKPQLSPEEARKAAEELLRKAKAKREVCICTSDAWLLCSHTFCMRDRFIDSTQWRFHLYYFAALASSFMRGLAGLLNGRWRSAG